MALSSDIPQGTLVGELVFVDEDSLDTGSDIDVIIPTGTVRIVCDAKGPLRIPGKPLTVVPLQFDGKVSEAGRLVPKNGDGDGIRLPATDSPLTTPRNFTYTISFDLVDPRGNKPIPIPSFSFQVPEGSTVDLATLFPADTSPGTITLQGVAKPVRRAHYPACHPGSTLNVPATTPYAFRRACVLPVAVERFRVHVRNYNFLTDTPATGNMSNFELYIGKHKMTSTEAMSGEFISAPYQVASGVTLTGGTEWVSGWVNPNQFKIDAYEHFLIGYAFTAPAGSQITSGSGSQWAAAPAPAGAASALLPPGPYASNQSYLDVWIEYEARTAQPTVLVLGNSHTDPGNVGGSPTRGEFTGWPHKLMMKTGALVSNLAVSASWLTHYAANSPKWSYLNTAEYTPDIVFLAELNSSDIASGVSMAENKTNMAATVGKIRALWPKARIIGSNILPRGDQGGGTEVLKREWNAFFSTCPFGIEQVLDADRLLRAPERSRSGLWPVIPTATPERVTVTKGTTYTSGGTFTAGHCFWTVEAINTNGATAMAYPVEGDIVAGGRQQLSWNAFDGEPALQLYRVWRGTAGDAASMNTWVADVAPGTTSYLDTGSSNGVGAGPGYFNLTPDIARLAPKFIAGTDNVHYNEAAHEELANHYAPAIAAKDRG